MEIPAYASAEFDKHRLKGCPYPKAACTCGPKAKAQPVVLRSKTGVAPPAALTPQQPRFFDRFPPRTGEK